jgi:hypothetical protein
MYYVADFEAAAAPALDIRSDSRWNGAAIERINWTTDLMRIKCMQFTAD